MKNKYLKTTLFICILTITSIFVYLTGLNIFLMQYDWDNDVVRYLNNRIDKGYVIESKTDIFGFLNKKSIYKVKTNIDYLIEFDVECSWKGEQKSKISIPSLFKKEQSIKDNYDKKVLEYINNNFITININNLTIEDIVDEISKRNYKIKLLLEEEVSDIKIINYVLKSDNKNIEFDCSYAADKDWLLVELKELLQDN